jgi:hypothetical protein
MLSLIISLITRGHSQSGDTDHQADYGKRSSQVASVSVR